mmetsp:Transcript_164767/g.316385  ORF Transcript_164767/g.316385 Transcript_164767/m.316385 type:complete len:166 (+) Transcript_164767:2-499(+)
MRVQASPILSQTSLSSALQRSKPASSHLKLRYFGKCLLRLVSWTTYAKGMKLRSHEDGEMDSLLRTAVARVCVLITGGFEIRLTGRDHVCHLPLPTVMRGASVSRLGTGCAQFLKQEVDVVSLDTAAIQDLIQQLGYSVHLLRAAVMNLTLLNLHARRHQEWLQF